MTDEVRNILRGFVVVVAILVYLAWRPAMAQDRAAQKEALRLQATEFCAFTMPPQQEVADLLNNALAQDPTKWLPIISRWNRMVERWRRLGCSDA